MVEVPPDPVPPLAAILSDGSQTDGAPAFTANEPERETEGGDGG